MNENSCKIDWMAALFSGVVAVCLLALFPYPGIHPSVWGDLAAAGGIRPPQTVMPGLYRCLVAPFAASFPYGTLAKLLHVTGVAVGGLVAALFTLLLGELLPSLVRDKLWLVRRTRLVIRGYIQLGTLIFLCNDAVWRLCQCFCPGTLTLLLAVAAGFTLCRYLYTCRAVWICTGAALSGLLASGSPLGFLLLLVAGGAVVVRPPLTPGNPNESNPLVRILTVYRVTVLFGVFFLISACIVLIAFDVMGGTEFKGGPVQSVTAYVAEFFRTVRFAANSTGWVMAIVFVFLPFLCEIALLNYGMIIDRFIHFPVMVIYGVAGLLACSQSVGIQDFWFRSWSGLEGCLRSDILIAVFGAFGAIVVVWTFLVMYVRVFFIGARRLAEFQFQDALETNEGEAAVTSISRLNRAARVLMALLPVAVAAGMVPACPRSMVRGMLAVLDGYVRETVAEASGTNILFTDGAFDVAIELMAGKGRLFAVSLFSGSSAYDKAMRMRTVMESLEDRRAMRSGAVGTLRYWITERQIRLPFLSLQLGAEYWQQKQRKALRVSGTVMRPVMDEALRVAGVEAAHGLAEWILRLYGTGNPGEVPDVVVRKLFEGVQWRLARLCQERADSETGARNEKAAAYEQSLYDRLDIENGAFRRMRNEFIRLTNRRSMYSMPRERLRFALDAADFQTAAVLADSIVREDPDDPQANFALGMDDFVNGRLDMAEARLKRVLKRVPNDAASLNNLAIIALRGGRYKEGVEYAEAASAAAPNNPRVARLLKRAREMQVEEEAKVMTNTSRQSAKGVQE